MMQATFRALRVLAVLLLLSVSTSVPAIAAGDGGSGSSGKSSDPDWVAARKAIDQENFAAAVPLLNAVVSRDSQNADAFNYLGYALSHLEKYDESKAAYDKALALKPDHRGANEYLGELYLKLGNLPAAEERLKVLDSACFFGCEEYDDLKEAIARYKRTGSYGGGKH